MILVLNGSPRLKRKSVRGAWHRGCGSKIFSHTLKVTQQNRAINILKDIAL